MTARWRGLFWSDQERRILLSQCQIPQILTVLSSSSLEPVQSHEIIFLNPSLPVAGNTLQEGRQWEARVLCCD